MKIFYSTILSAIILATFSDAFSETINAAVNPQKKFQRIEYFGASDAWSTQYVGDYWEDFLKEKAAKLLFSQKFDESGNPEGIGLSLWRVNLGGGSLEGDKSPIKFQWRGARCFIDPKSGEIDMSRCEGLRYFMKKSKGIRLRRFFAVFQYPANRHD